MPSINAAKLVRRYVHGAGVDEPLVQYTGAGTTTRAYLITDHQGSVIAENGATTTRYSYGPYGEPNTWVGQRFRYTGQIALPEIGLYHYKARAYCPECGRFLQTDPVGYEEQLNLYAYVGNDPLNRTDPTGECERQARDDGTLIQVGICGADDASRELVDGMLADPNSRTSEVEAVTIAQGALVRVRTGQQTPSSPDRPPREVNGAATEVGGRFSTGQAGVVVTLDITDTAIVSGVDATTGARVTDYVQSDQESLEHEIVGHAYDAVRGMPQNEARAIAAENRYRERHGTSFRRVGHRGHVVRREEGIPP